VFASQFLIGVFDGRAAALAAELEAAYSTPEQVEKALARVDAMILATALVWGARKLITTNTKHLQPMAHGRSIEVMELPAQVIQMEFDGLYAEQETVVETAEG
jgi:hypothetical protein